LDAQRLRRLLHVGHLNSRIGIVRIDDHSHTRQARYNFLENREPFSREISRDVRETGYVSARSSEIGDESRAHRVRDTDHDDGYFRDGGLGRRY
jgi:hypothetical protein